MVYIHFKLLLGEIKKSNSNLLKYFSIGVIPITSDLLKMF